MQSRSPRFDKEISGSHRVFGTATVFRLGVEVGELPVVSGSWTDDGSADVRKRCAIQCEPGELFVPAQAYHDDWGLWPVGNEVQLDYGIDYGDGTSEVIPIGRFPIAEPQVNDDGSVSLAVTAIDRSSLVSRARFSSSYSIRRGTDQGTAIRDLIMSRIPSMGLDDFDFMVTDMGKDKWSSGTPSVTIGSQDDPWVVAQSMAVTLGADLFFDQSGRCVLRKQRDPSVEKPDWIFEDGEGSNIVSIERKITSDGGYNGVIVDCTNSDLRKPIHAEYWDTDPTSPTYYDPADPSSSMYGPYPYFFSSEYFTSQGQAEDAARSMFLSKCGLSEMVSFEAICNPCNESGDVITVRSDKVKVDGDYVIESINGTLGSSAKMSVRAKVRRAVS